MAAITYLPAPVRVEGNNTSDEPDFKLWLASTVALGTLAYYAPKTFLVASAGIFGYQVYRFNQLVQAADSTPQQIHTWTINACIVMSAIASVFLLKPLPCVLSALHDVRHLNIIRCMGHIVKALVFAGIGAYLYNFTNSAKTLASQRSWVKMEDYVKNYPQEVKKDVLSTYKKQLDFYICAVIPQTWIAEYLSRDDFARIQFSSNEQKRRFVSRYLNEATRENWALAIHQLRQLPAEVQLALAENLAAIATKQFTIEEQNAFPNDIKALIIGVRLKAFDSIPAESHVSIGEWYDLIRDFNLLGLDAQEILGDACLRLLGPNQTHTEKTSSEFRLAALKAIPLLIYKHNISSPIEIAEKNFQAEALLDSLLPEHKINLGAFLKKSSQDSKIYPSRLSEKLKAVIPKD